MGFSGSHTSLFVSLQRTTEPIESGTLLAQIFFFPPKTMDDSTRKDFLTLRKLLNVAQTNSNNVHSCESSSNPTQPFDFDFRTKDYGSQTVWPHELSLIRCDYTHCYAGVKTAVSSQTDESSGISCKSSTNCCDRTSFIRELELNLLESESRRRQIKEHQLFWRSLALDCLFSASIPVSLIHESEATVYTLILTTDEWFLFDDTNTDNDPTMCMTSKFITVTLELERLLITVVEMTKGGLTLHFLEKRDMLKLFLAALSYSNIPVKILDPKFESSSVLVAPRE